MDPDFLAFLAEHYDDLRAFARAFLRDRTSTADFLRRIAPRLQQRRPARAGLPWALAEAARELQLPLAPLRRPKVFDVLVPAFLRRRRLPADRGARLDAALQSLSQDAQPVLTARYEKDLDLESVAWRFRTGADHVLGALTRIRRILLQALRGRLPHELCRVHELTQKHLESISDGTELSAALTSSADAADLFADACLLDADLSAYFTRDIDGPDEGVSLALQLAERPRAARRVKREG